MRIFLAILVKAITKNSDCLRFLTVKTRLSSRIIESRNRYVTFPWEQNVLIATNRGPVNMAQKIENIDMHGYPLNDCTQEQSDSPNFSSIVRQCQ